MHKLLARFSLTQKFMILGLMAFVLVSALTYLLVSTADEDIDFVRQEIKGSESIVTVMSLLQTVQQHRGLSSLVLSGKKEVIPSWDAKRKEVDQAVEAIDAVNKRFPELNLANDWHAVKGQWQKLKTDVAELSPHESFNRHTALIESIMRFLNLIADNSNISYDRTVESYTIGQIASANMPMSTEFMGRMRAFGAVLLGQQNVSGSDRARIDVYVGMAQYEFEKLNLALNKIYAVNPELKSVFKASHQEMESKVKEALKLINEQIVNSKKLDYPSQQYVATLTRAIDAQFVIIRVVDEQLQISLNAQANRLATKKHTILMVVVLLFALCLAVAMTVMRRILIQVQTITKALGSIAQGDLDARADMPHTSDVDEFVQIACSFDNMAAALQARQAETVRAEALLQSVLDSALDAFIRINAQGQVTDWNLQAERMFGYSRADAVGKLLESLIIPPSFREAHRRGIEHFFKTGEGPLLGKLVEVTAMRASGGELPVEIAIVESRSGNIFSFNAFMRDISARKQAEEEIRQLNADLRQFKDTLDQTLDCIFMFDPDTLRFIYVNEGAKRQVGYSEAELLKMTLVDIKPEITLEQFQKMVQPLIDGVLPVLTFQTVHRHKDGHDIPVEIFLQLVRLEGQASRFMAMVADISARKQAEEEIHRLAYIDTITGLPNRTRFHELVEEAVVAAQREQRPIALLLMDLDRFKEVNDTLGHKFGDGLLQKIGTRLRSALFAPDVIARLGGDEFGILLPRLATIGDVMLVIKKLQHLMEAPFILDEIPIVVEAAIGVATMPGHASDADTLLQQADIAMYYAKQMASGYAIYTPEYNLHTPERLGLMAELRDAVEQNQLLLHFQPKLELKTGRIIGTEALVRWQHPLRGLLFPDKFILAAEQTGLVGPLTRWVLTDALSKCQGACREGIRMRVSVNLSARSLHDLQLPGMIAAVLAASGVEPGLLMLEITESAIVLDPARAEQTLVALSGMGIGLSIDDFGTGYTSLASIKRLPINEIKIDRSFITDMLTNKKDAMIVRTIIELGHNFGLTVVAEGVETQEVLDALAALGCDEIQGYFISKPQAFEPLKSWLSTSSYKIGPDSIAC